MDASESPVPVASVAIVGRPNVGKSTLFNRLLGRRRAIVHNAPGVTRDRIFGRAEVGPGQSVELIDTGGLIHGDDPLGLNAQVKLAIEECDLLLLVVDGREGLVPADERVWEELRRYGRPTVLVVNKGDTQAAQRGFGDFFRLGIDPQLLVSAEHGLGIEALREEMARHAPQLADGEPDLPALAIVGRPNVGKSSLLNRWVGRDRALVSPQAGTTRDPLDTVIESGASRYRLIDTAGIRRRSQVSGVAEDLAVMMARRQIARADIALLVVDAAAGVTSGDLSIAGSIWEAGRGAVVVVNKWDLLDPDGRQRLEESWSRLEEILRGPPRVNISALTGRGIERILPVAEAALERYRVEVSTSELNRVLERAVDRHSPPAPRGKPWTFYYATQVSTGPPTFMVFANRSLAKGHIYRRYLENQLRQALELPGIPLRLVVRRREGTAPR